MTMQFLSISGIALASALSLVSLPAAAQFTAGDTVVVGTTPAQQAALQAYWAQLLGLNAATTQALPAETDPAATAAAPNPQLLEQEIMRKLRVNGLQLKRIYGLSSSSELVGSVTNLNAKPVTLSGINYEIVDASGAVIQTGSATPAPATLAPRQTVTFRDSLPSTSVIGKTARLSRTPFVIQGGI